MSRLVLLSLSCPATASAEDEPRCVCSAREVRIILYLYVLASLASGWLSYGTTMNAIPALQGPLPALFCAWAHHRPPPKASTVLEVTEQVPVPVVQPTSEAVYIVLILLPVLSLTQMKYDVAVGTAFHV